MPKPNASNCRFLRSGRKIKPLQQTPRLTHPNDSQNTKNNNNKKLKNNSNNNKNKKTPKIKNSNNANVKNVVRTSVRASHSHQTTSLNECIDISMDDSLFVRLEKVLLVCRSCDVNIKNNFVNFIQSICS